MIPPVDPSLIVRDGYDRLGDVYRDWIAGMREGPRARFLEEIIRLLPGDGDVLELGCGPGTDAPALARGRRYTGVDLSRVQLAHARDAVPEGTFIRGDLFDVELPPAGFDVVVAFYVFGHVPATGLEELFERVRSWLRPGGWLCASFGTSDNAGAIETKWLGAADMYFSSLLPDRTQQLLLDAGFSIRSAEVITEIEPEGPATFLWVIARAPLPKGIPA